MLDIIIKFLNLKEDDVKLCLPTVSGDDAVIFIELYKKPHKCPNCGEMTTKTKGYHHRIINHGIFNFQKCIVHYNQRRYQCKFCGRTFNEECSLVVPYQKKSLASHLQIMDLAKNPRMTFTMIAKALNLSHTTVINHFYNNLPKFQVLLPRVLCIDEVYLGRRYSKKYATHLLNFQTNTTIDIFYGRTKDDFRSYLQKMPLEQRKKVEYVSTDMYEGFRYISNIYFPNARLCVDSFHVIQLINNNFHDILKSLLRDYAKGSDEYYLLKSQKALLLHNSSTIKWFDEHYDHHYRYHLNSLNLKERLFRIDPIIREAYELKEEYIAFNRLRDIEVIKPKLDILINKFLTFPHPNFRKVGRTLLKWKSEIISSFTLIDGRRISNGSIESRNKTIKLLSKNASGYRNFSHFKLRSIYVINSNKKTGK